MNKIKFHFFTKCCLLALTLSASVANASDIVWPKLPAHKQPLYDAIYAPVEVAVPYVWGGPETLGVNDAGELHVGGSTLIGGQRKSAEIVSHDLGLNWEKRLNVPSNYAVKCPWDNYRLVVGGPGSDPDKTQGFCWRHREKAPGKYVIDVRARVPGAVSYGHLRPLPKNRRWAYVTAARVGIPKMVAVGHPSVCLSTDDGATWRCVQVTNIIDVVGFSEPDKQQRWRVGCEEPDIVELNDGTLMMMTRASTDHHVFYFSKDGGETWSEPRELPWFWAHNTMPFIMRLKDGRILAIWNNTQILPELPAADYPELGESSVIGCWENIFTNRDALHAAISEDDGKTWIGFREIALNPIRDRCDYREVGNEFWTGNIDKSVHQESALELPGGKIAVHYGQNGACSRVLIFDVRWLYEKSREEDLRTGMNHLSSFLFLKSRQGGMAGWSGHCALNRVPGATMAREPGTNLKIITEALHICRIRDERLLNEKQGVNWNFPAAQRGEVEFECRIDGAGVLVSLCDHWINPCDWAIRQRSMFSVPLTSKAIGGPGKWKVVKFAWDLAAKTVTVSVDGHSKALPLKTEGFSPAGVSYLHLQTLAETHDPDGVYIHWFKMRATDLPQVISRRADRGERTGLEFYQDVKSQQPGKDNAVNLFVVEPDGRERQLTFGCQIDYGPALSADGKTVYFSSTRGIDPKVLKGPYTDGAGIMSVPLAGGEPKLLVPAPEHGCSCIDPAPSPDATALLWAEAGGYRTPFQLMIAPLSNLKAKVALTEKTMSAHSPKWIDNHTVEFIGFRRGDKGWQRYRINTCSKAVRRLGPADYASAPSGKTYRPVPEVKAPAKATPAPKFEKIALVDSYDFLGVYDLMKKESCDQVVDHVLLTGADTLLWRQQSGGMPRYCTEEEDRSRIPMSCEKLRAPYSNPVSTFVDLCYGLKYDHVLGGLDAIRRRGKIAGIHYTMEEAHWSNAMLNQWTVEHPQYWCADRNGTIWMGHASLAYPEVVEHRLRQLDELLAMEPEVIYIDACCRCGGYTPACEFVPPLLAEWKRCYGDAELPKSSGDARWIGIVSGVYHNYLRAMRKRLDATGRKIRMIIVSKEDANLGGTYPDRPTGWVGTYSLANYGFDWVALLKEGTLDGVAVEAVRLHYEKGTEDILAETEKVYRGVKAVAGDKPVYFPIMQYNFGGWRGRPGVPEYAKILKISQPEAAKKLLQLAKDCGGAGITMECVDYNNYKAINEVIRDFE